MDHLQAWKKYGSLTYDDLPDDVIKVAGQCILDWFGCALVEKISRLQGSERVQF